MEDLFILIDFLKLSTWIYFPINKGPYVPLIPYTQPLLIFRYFVLVHCICTFLFWFLWYWIYFLTINLHTILLLLIPKFLLIEDFLRDYLVVVCMRRPCRPCIVFGRVDREYFYYILIFEWHLAGLKINSSSVTFLQYLKNITSLFSCM